MTPSSDQTPDHLTQSPHVQPSAPRITVLMTVLNGMPYLPEAVESILAQTLPDLLLLVINDGSTDGTASYLDSVDDSRLIVRHLPKTIGRTPALNLGFSEITTPYTAILDGDDVALPSRLARQVAFLDTTPDVAMVAADYLLVDPHGNSLGQVECPAKHAPLVNLLAVQNVIAHSACSFRTTAVRFVGGYPPEYDYAQDMGLWLALLQQGNRIASLPETLAHIRVHPAQATQNPAKVRLRRQEAVWLAHGLCDVPGISADARQVARLREGIFLLRLHRWREGFRSLYCGLAMGPIRLLRNSLLRQRLALSLRKRR